MNKNRISLAKLILVRKEREKAAMLTGRSFNSTSKIDSFARILFPLTFTLFNCVSNFYLWSYAGRAAK